MHSVNAVLKVTCCFPDMICWIHTSFSLWRWSLFLLIYLVKSVRPSRLSLLDLSPSPSPSWSHASTGHHWTVLLHIFLPFSHRNVTLCFFHSSEANKHVFSLLYSQYLRTITEKIPRKCSLNEPRMMEVAKPIRREQCTNIFSNIDSNKVWTYMDYGKGTNVFGFLGPISTTLVFHRYHNTKVLCLRLLKFWWHIPKNESVR